MARDDERERIRERQGSTLLWTERYGAVPRRAAVLEDARDLFFAFYAGVLLLALAEVATSLTRAGLGGA